MVLLPITLGPISDSEAFQTLVNNEFIKRLEKYQGAINLVFKNFQFNEADATRFSQCKKYVHSLHLDNVTISEGSETSLRRSLRGLENMDTLIIAKRFPLSVRKLLAMSWCSKFPTKLCCLDLQNVSIPASVASEIARIVRHNKAFQALYVVNPSSGETCLTPIFIGCPGFQELYLRGFLLSFGELFALSRHVAETSANGRKIDFFEMVIPWSDNSFAKRFLKLGGYIAEKLNSVRFRYKVANPRNHPECEEYVDYIASVGPKNLFKKLN